jgi:pullulanase/glycogen debranching enzyme
VFARSRFLDDDAVTWLLRDGTRLAQDAWLDPRLAAFGMWLAGPRETLLLLNGGAHGCFFTLPEARGGGEWRALASSACATPGRPRRGRVRLAAHSFTYLPAEPAP